MLGWLKRLHRTATFGDTCDAVEFHWGVCFAKVARRSGARLYDIAFWQEVAESFCAKWREIEPASHDPARLLERRLSEYLSFLRDTVLKEAECRNLTTAQLEQVARFFARASVLDLRAAVLSDPERVSPIFDLLPHSWLETAGITSEEFDHCYFERTGKRRAVQKLENRASKDLADNTLRHGRKPDEAQRVSPTLPQASPEMESRFQKGESYYYGIGVSNDYAEAVKWFRMAAELGHARAQCFLGLCYARGQGVSQDWAQAVHWYRKAAEQGNADAQCYLGVCCDTPRGVPQDYAQAVQWYRQAAEQGHATAQLYLGFCYEGGRGVPQDYTQAVQWYRKAAEQGDEYAQYNLGLCYEKGRGVPQDYAQAAQWYHRAAEQGQVGTQHGLGFCYKGGRGVPSSHHPKGGRHQ